MKEYMLDENGFLVPRELWNEAHEVGKSPPTVGTGRKKKPIVPCPVCGIHITQRGLERHIRAAHPNATQSAVTKVDQVPSSRNSAISKKPLVECTICGQRVRDDRLARHMRKVHAEQMMPTPTDNAESSDPATPPKHVEQAFIQSHDEPMDGGKYLGHMEREWDGKFGSLPLYDDHNDEADADSPVKASSV